ncbi:MAG: hypothetical protein MJK13_05025, partial [Pseudomonadales bacterium]|nr:hypothetical protein [Pseudomonadales bacterium]
TESDFALAAVIIAYSVADAVTEPFEGGMVVINQSIGGGENTPGLVLNNVDLLIADLSKVTGSFPKMRVLSK